jgi:hypothetical protein
MNCNGWERSLATGTVDRSALLAGVVDGEDEDVAIVENGVDDSPRVRSDEVRLEPVVLDDGLRASVADVKPLLDADDERLEEGGCKERS